MARTSKELQEKVNDNLRRYIFNLASDFHVYPSMNIDSIKAIYEYYNKNHPDEIILNKNINTVSYQLDNINAIRFLNYCYINNKKRGNVVLINHFDVQRKGIDIKSAVNYLSNKGYLYATTDENIFIMDIILASFPRDLGFNCEQFLMVYEDNYNEEINRCWDFKNKVITLYDNVDYYVDDLGNNIPKPTAKISGYDINGRHYGF